jgi:hypothetical protein
MGHGKREASISSSTQLSKVGGFSSGLNFGFTAAIGISNSGVRQLMAGQ